MAEVDWGDADGGGAAPPAEVDWGAEIDVGPAASAVEVDGGGDGGEVDWGGDAAGAGGDAIEVDWGGEWWRGTSGVTRWSTADDAVLTRVAYAAAQGYQAHTVWHNTEEMSWREAC